MSREGTFAPLQSRVISWLQQAHIDKVVVGHQPAGDCVAVLPSKSVAAGNRNKQSFSVSADTCYSTFVQYDVNFLNTLFSSPANSTENDTIEEDWKSVTPLLREKGLLSPIIANTTTRPSSSDRADTRAPLCVAEPVIVFEDAPPRLFLGTPTVRLDDDDDDNPNEVATSAASEAVVGEGKIELKGVLASGHVHGVTLPEPREEAIVGHEVGWLVGWLFNMCLGVFGCVWVCLLNFGYFLL